jgi:DNA-binding beta-propeller fold protein YncE
MNFLIFVAVITDYVKIDHVALDISNEKLYYTDSYSGTISVMSTSGTNYRTLLTVGSTDPFPVAIVVDSKNGYVQFRLL